MKTSILPAAAAILMLSACASTPDPHPLTGTQWQLVAIDTSGSTTTLNPDLQARHTVAFLAEGAAQIRLDCNRSRSTWTAAWPRDGGGTIAFGPIASTRMACPEPSFGTALASGLQGAQRFVTSDEGRELSIESGQLRLTFIPAR